MTQTSDDIANEAMRQWADSSVNKPLQRIIQEACEKSRREGVLEGIKQGIHYARYAVEGYEDNSNDAG